MASSSNGEGRMLLSVRDLHTVFHTPQGPVHAVDGVSFDLGAGETLGIVGESGSGKSVLVRSIMNLLPDRPSIATKGEVRFDGRDIRALSPPEEKHFWGTEMAMVFQDPMTSLNPVKRIGTQLTESLRFHLKLGRRAALDRAVELLDHVRIPDPRRRLEQYPHELSGGMRQRVLIAIALACEPRLLVADEPTTALDVTVQRQILDLLAELQQERGMAMIIITHDLGVVAGQADRVAVMYGGQLMEVADTQSLFARVRHPYTEALLNSIPKLDQPSHTRLTAIGGRPPDLANPPSGCRFADRCSYVTNACRERIPSFVPLSLDGSDGSGVRCLTPLGVASTSAGDSGEAHGGASAELALDESAVR